MAADRPSRRDRPSSAARRLVVLLALAAVPWTAIPASRGLALVFPWGLANTHPPGITLLHEYVALIAGLPRYLEAIPISAGLYALALASATGGILGREDRRVTAGLLAIAGASHLLVSLGFFRIGRTALPVGPLMLWAAAWWVYEGDLFAADP